jgi:uncharacterized protein YjiS (DUF1127 family)
MTKLGKKISRWLTRQARMRKTVRELSALSDKDLADIGIHRSNIYDVVRSHL